MSPIALLLPLTPYLLFFIGMAVLSAVLRSAWFKGILGEAILKFSAFLLLDAKLYRRFHNVTLMTDDGSTQIDHVFVSRFGVFVVETKNLKGWIFGAANQPMWTQKIYRNNFRFQNPLRQNYKHTKAIEAALGLSPEQVFSVVVFVGGSEFKTVMPPNVTYGGGCARYILSHRQPLSPTRRWMNSAPRSKPEGSRRASRSRASTCRTCSNAMRPARPKPAALAAAGPCRYGS